MSPRQQHVTESIGLFLWGLAWPLLAGALLGALLLLLLHRRGLRFTWSLLGLPLTWCAWFGPDRRGAVILGAATATAIWLGHRLRVEGLALGGEEAHRHRDTLGPLAFLRSRLSGLRDGRRRGRTGTFAIGRDRRGRPARAPIGSPGHGVHVLVAGATGSGKTVSQDSIIGAHARVGQGVISVDPKGDPRHLRRLEALAAETGARLVVWSPGGPTVYNPLRRGDPTEIADKCLAAHEWTEPHYELATRRLLGHALATMRAAGEWPPTLSGLVAVMEPDRLDALASKLGGEVAERVCGYVDQLSGSARADLGGGRDRLAVLVESELGPCLDPSLGPGEEVDLAATLDHGDIVYLRLDSDRYPAASRLLASALVIDLVGLAAARQGSSRAAVVAIDEFGATAGDQVSRLFARARGAGISVVLGTQSLADLRAVGGGEADTLTEQVISNVSYTLAHRVADPDSAERLARVAGTEPAWAMTQRVEGHGFLPSGQGTRMRERDFVVQPDQFKRLGTGEAVLIRPTARPPARIIRVRPPEPAPSGVAGLLEKGDPRWP